MTPVRNCDYGIILRGWLGFSRGSLEPAGSVLMVVRSGILAHTFPVVIARTDVTLNQDMKAITPKGGLSSEFLAYQLRALGPTILKSCTKSGTTVASVETKQLQSLPFWLPSDEMQTKIVVELDKHLSRLEATVTTLQGIQAKLKQARASILKAALEGRLVETEAELAMAEHRDFQPASERLLHIQQQRQPRYELRKGRHRSPTIISKSEPGEERPPSGWILSTVGQLIDDIQAGKSFAALNTPPDITQTGIAKISAVTWGSYNEDESKTVMDPDLINENYIIKAGDLLMSRANTVELVGAAVIASKVKSELCLATKFYACKLQVKSRSGFFGSCAVHAAESRLNLYAQATKSP